MSNANNQQSSSRNLSYSELLAIHNASQEAAEAAGIGSASRSRASATRSRGSAVPLQPKRAAPRTPTITTATPETTALSEPASSPSSSQQSNIRSTQPRDRTLPVAPVASWKTLRLGDCLPLVMLLFIISAAFAVLTSGYVIALEAVDGHSSVQERCHRARNATIPVVDGARAYHECQKEWLEYSKNTTAELTSDIRACVREQQEDCTLNVVLYVGNVLGARAVRAACLHLQVLCHGVHFLLCHAYASANSMVVIVIIAACYCYWSLRKAKEDRALLMKEIQALKSQQPLPTPSTRLSAEGGL